MNLSYQIALAVQIWPENNDFWRNCSTFKFMRIWPWKWDLWRHRKSREWLWGSKFFPLEDIKISGVLKKVWDEKDVFLPHFPDLKFPRAQCAPPNMNRVKKSACLSKNWRPLKTRSVFLKNDFLKVKKVKNLAWQIDESSEDSACLLKLGVSSKTLACLLKQKSKRLNTAKIKKAYFWKIYEKP